MKALARALAWICVAVPLGWGVYQSVQKSLPLFKTHSQPAAPSAQAR
jgi:hypothetical protein